MSILTKEKNGKTQVCWNIITKLIKELNIFKINDVFYKLIGDKNLVSLS